MKKKYVIASDHSGYKLKRKIIAFLNNKNIDVIDLGTDSAEKAVSYADYGHKLAEFMTKNKKEKLLGIGICGTGLGISYALNRHKNIRAARLTSKEDAKFAKLHNDANVLVFGARQIKFRKVINIIENFEKYDFEGGRHIQRIKKIDKI